jgi:hypothetical protein
MAAMILSAKGRVGSEMDIMVFTVLMEFRLCEPSESATSLGSIRMNLNLVYRWYNICSFEKLLQLLDVEIRNT